MALPEGHRTPKTKTHGPESPWANCKEGEAGQRGQQDNKEDQGPARAPRPLGRQDLGSSPHAVHLSYKAQLKSHFLLTVP